jgi:hypothetical protein
METALRHERPHEGLLDEIVGFPGALREVSAISIELGAERLVLLEAAAPIL